MSKHKESYRQVQIKNRRARFEFQLQDSFIAGMVLTGTEIKSIRLGKANLQDAYCVFEGDELWVLGMHISPYEQANHYNHEATRKRKLLLNKSELKKLYKISKDEGITIIPTRLFINNRGLAKLEFAPGKGKKLYDKRHDIRKKDEEREIRRMRF
ncbi:MAG: SsrA-binding protein [Cyclobacteriaceae bacterium]|nr:MAG: SsrA-binding protein [Cyclobacteriaceae bacterium]